MILIYSQFSLSNKLSGKDSVCATISAEIHFSALPFSCTRSWHTGIACMIKGLTHSLLKLFHKLSNNLDHYCVRILPWNIFSNVHGYMHAYIHTWTYREGKRYTDVQAETICQKGISYPLQH